VFLVARGGGLKDDGPLPHALVAELHGEQHAAPEQLQGVWRGGRAIGVRPVESAYEGLCSMSSSKGEVDTFPVAREDGRSGPGKTVVVLCSGVVLWADPMLAAAVHAVHNASLRLVGHQRVMHAAASMMLVRCKKMMQK
jgi:hypothetical protein